MCKVSRNCSHNPFEAVNYADDIVRDALIRGLGYSDIQQHVLGHNDLEMTLGDTIKFIEAKKLVNDHKQLSRTRVLRQYPRIKKKKKNTVFLHIKYLKSKQLYGGQCKTVLLK